MEAHLNSRPVAGPKRSPWVLVPPPPLFVLAFVAGLKLDHMLTVPLVPAWAWPLERVVGAGLLAAAALTMLWAPVLFLLYRTTIIPHSSARSLVTSGPYRFSRNPMYLGLAAAQIGLSLLLHAFWPLLLVALPVWVLQRRVIPYEETILTRNFGAEYEAYRRRVHRWI